MTNVRSSGSSGVLLSLMSAAVIGTFCGGCSMDRWLLYVPIAADSYELPHNKAPDEQVHEIAFDSEDGTEIVMVLATQAEPAKHPTVLYMHGQGGHVDNFWRFAMLLWSRGYNVAVLDYRGFGKSEGDPDEEGLLMDGRAAYRTLAKRADIDPKRLVIWGFSLGSGIGSATARRFAPRSAKTTEKVPKPVALVLESPFSSMAAMIEGSGPITVPSDWVSDVTLDNLGNVVAMELPLVVAHGRADRRIPFRMGEEVHEKAHKPKAFVPVDGADHGEVLDQAATQVFTELATVAPPAAP